MEEKTCVIFAAGDFEGCFEKSKDTLVIAADAGYHHLRKLGIEPDILLGDFDTIGDIPEHDNIIRFQREKDYTDTELSIMEGMSRGCRKFVIYGALGGKRFEHTLANVYLAAAYAEKGCDITLTDGNYIVKPIHNSSLSFDENQRGFVSVFEMSGRAEGVTIKGLKYNLDNHTLDMSNPTLCVSNEFVGQKSEISVKDGTIIIIWQNNSK